jgi:chemotaxis signal transduction protein
MKAVKESSVGVPKGLVFCSGGGRYLMPLSQVRRIVSAASVRSLPEEQPWLVGCLNYAGHIIPVLRLEAKPRKSDAQVDELMILVEWSNNQAAIIVEQVEEILDLPDSMTVSDSGTLKFLNLEDTTIVSVELDILVGGGETMACA